MRLKFCGTAASSACDSTSVGSIHAQMPSFDSCARREELADKAAALEGGDIAVGHGADAEGGDGVSSSMSASKATFAEMASLRRISSPSMSALGSASA